MTGSDFYTYVLKKFKRTDKETECYQAMTDTISDMRLQIVSEDYKEEAYNVGIDTDGEYRIALPADFSHLIGRVTVVDPDNNDVRTLSKISKEEYDIIYGERLFDAVGDMDTALPKVFCIFGGQIYLGPVPDKLTYKYQINYSTEDSTEITSATTTVPFATKYRNILRAGVLSELHDGLENFQEAQYWRQLYIEGLSKINSNDLDNIRDESNVSYNGV